MRKYIILLLLIIGLSALVVGPVELVEAAQNDVVTEELCKDDAVAESCESSIFAEDGLILSIVNVLIKLVGGVAVIVIVVAGLMYIISGGDGNSVARAKNALLYAVIGLAVALAAQAIVSFVLTTTS